MTNDEALAQLNLGFRDFIPLNRELGFSIIEVNIAQAWLVAQMPFNQRWVGHRETGLLHGGVITALLDGSGAACVYLRLGQPEPIATLDLRIDYLKPGRPADVFTLAECIKVTRNVAFVRMTAYHDTKDQPIALGAATYMRTKTSPGGSP